MKNKSIKIGLSIVIAAMIVAAGVSSGLIYLNSGSFREMIVEQVNSALDGRLEVTGHRVSLLSGRLVLSGIRLERADGQPLVEVARLEINLTLPALLRRTIHVSLLELEKVNLLMELDDQDQLMLVGPTAGERTPADTGEASPPWRVIVDDFRLKGGELVFRRPSRGWSGRMENLQLAGALDVARNHAELTFSAGPLTWRAGEAVNILPTAVLDVRYEGARPSTLTLKTAKSSLEAEGRVILSGAAPELDVTGELVLALDEVRPWIPGDVRLEGRVAARIAARGRMNDPAVDLQVTVPEGNLAGIDVAPLNAELKYGEGRISVSALNAQGRWGTLKSAGAVDIPSGRIDNGSALLTSPDLAALGTALGVELPSGSGRLKLSCEGPWSHPAAKAEVLAQELKLKQFELGRLLASADLDTSGVVTFTHLVLENQGSLVEGRGQLKLQRADGRWRADPGLDLGIDIKNLEAADFGLDLPVQGLINANIKIGGTVQHLQGKAALADSNLKWKDLLFDVRGSALWNDGRLTVSELSLSRDAAVLRLKGEALVRHPRSGQWMNAPLIEADLRSQGMELQDFWPHYHGALTVEAQVKGTPADLTGDFKLTGSDLELAGQPVSAAVVNGRLAGKVVYLDNLDVTLAAGRTITGRGFIGFDQRYELALDAKGIDLDLIPVLQQAYPVEGRLEFSLRGQGTFQKPLLTAQMTVRQPRLSGQPWDDFHLRARLQDRELDLDADLNFDLKAHGRLDSGDFDVAAQMDDADLSPYLAMAGGADWGGKLSGRIQAHGNWNRPRQIQAELDIAEALLRYQSLDLLSIRGLRAKLKDEKVDLPQSRLDLMQDGFVNVSASGDLRRDLRLTADGRLPLTALAPFSDVFAGAEGELTFQARVNGAPDKLQWRADMNMADIALVIPGLDQEVRNLMGHVRLNPDEVSVEKVTGRIDSGRFSLNGRVELTDLKPSGGKLVFSAQALPLQLPQTMDAVVNSDLTLQRIQNKSTLSGKIVLLEGTYTKNVNLNLLSAVSQPRRAVPVESSYELPPGLAEIVLSVSLTHRYPFLVDNNLARLQIAPDLKLIGTLGRPVISGRAQVTEGEVTFRSKNFTVKRGVVDFVNPYKIEPTLDITAEAQIRQWLVTLSLSGTPDKLALQLSSEPPESESDILSLILLGRTSGELAEGQSSGQSTRQMLATLIASAWGEDIKKTTGVDILEVETGTGVGGESDDSIQLTVGKKLSRRLTVKYEVKSGGQETVQRAVSEYRFLEHILASGFQDSLGGYGGELLFRIEF